MARRVISDGAHDESDAPGVDDPPALETPATGDSESAADTAAAAGTASVAETASPEIVISAPTTEPDGDTGGAARHRHGAWRGRLRRTVIPSVHPTPEIGPPHPDSTDELLRHPPRPARPLRSPVVLGQRRRPRVRRVTRIVRHVDTWSVFKVALVFSAFMYGVLLTAGVLLWQVARATGTIDNVERFFESFGWRTFELNGGEIYHSGWIIGIFLGIGCTGLAVLAATLFNLITDLVGGIRVSVLEEEVRARGDTTRRPIRRIDRRTAGTEPAGTEPAGTPSVDPTAVDPMWIDASPATDGSLPRPDLPTSPATAPGASHGSPTSAGQVEGD